MVKLRLRRIGKKVAPVYQIVAIDSHKKRDGAYIELLGHYRPAKDKTELKINKDRFDYWLSCGAQMTSVVYRLIKNYKPKITN